MMTSSYSSDGAKRKISLCESGGFSGYNLVGVILLSSTGWINTQGANSSPKLCEHPELS